MKTKLTAERLRELLHYDPATGFFTNSARRKKVRVGERAGYFDPSTGYIVLCIDRAHYYGHRLALLYMTGSWPVDMVDHRDGDRTNNVFTNLRDATRLLNQQNMRRASVCSSSGLLGAYRKRERWESKIRVDGSVIHLGVFGTAEEAHVAYVAAKRKHHPGCTI